jgi:hypothetical protein
LDHLVHIGLEPMLDRPDKRFGRKDQVHQDRLRQLGLRQEKLTPLQPIVLVVEGKTRLDLSSR